MIAIRVVIVELLSIVIDFLVQVDALLDLITGQNYKNMTEAEITIKIVNANSYQELIQILTDLDNPIVSTSRGENNLRYWDVTKIISRINLIRSGLFPNQVTRACGLRAKVCELVLTDNYGDGWELK